MYGMVNAAIESMVTEKFGPEKWAAVKARAGIEEPMFISMKQYPDSATYALAGAAAEELGMPLPDVLRAFGTYWVDYAKRGPYGRIMLSSGKGTYELLSALDDMHARLGMSFPELRPPSFRVEAQGDAVILEYRSERPGLAVFVEGLVEGVANLYGETVDVRQIASREAGAPHDRFLVRVTGRKG